jgi:hypothetical protein
MPDERQKLRILHFNKIGEDRSGIHIRLWNNVVTWVSLDVSPVAPGDPVPITWSVFSIHLDLGKVTARVFLDKGNAKLYESPPVLTSKSDTGLQQATILAPGSGGVANELYAIGTKTLRLDVSSDKTVDVFWTTADLAVMPENVNGGWWEWTNAISTPDPSTPLPWKPPLQGPSYSSVINHPFTLIGRVVNRAQNRNATMTGSAVLLETTYPGGAPTELESASFTVAPGGQQEIVFNPITRNWGWLIPGIWVHNFGEPKVKTLDYTVRLSMSDPFANSYHDVVSVGLRMQVSVSAEKKGYASGALATLAVGIVAAIFSFGAGLSAAQAVAGGLGKKAQDPPEPDARFRERVDFQSWPETAPAAEDTRFSECLAVLGLASRAVFLIDALGTIENRMLGALLAEDNRAGAIQAESYRQAERLLQRTIRRLMVLAQTAGKALASRPEFAPEVIGTNIREWQRGGVPRDVRAALTEQGCTDEAVATVMSAIDHPTAASLATEVGQSFGLLQWSFAMIGREVRRETVALLRRVKRTTRGRTRRQKARPRRLTQDASR